MNPPPKSDFCSLQGGFTLVELIIVIVVLGVMSAYAVMHSVSPAELSLTSQAATMASNIRHAQTLAYTTGQRMRLSVTPGANGSYGVSSCVINTSTCTTTVFSVALEKGVVLGPTSPSTLYFNSLGQPYDSATAGLALSGTTSYTLTSGSTKTVAIAALTGLVTVTP